MNRRIRGLLAGVFLSGLCNCATVSPIIDDAVAIDSTEVGREGLMIAGEFPVAWLEQLQFAYSAFRKTSQQPDCFNVRLLRWEGEWHISFMPEPEVLTQGTKIRTKHGNTSCGQGVTWVFDDDKKFVRRYFSR